jgi:membrane associated rhomboid family serine protease
MSDPMSDPMSFPPESGPVREPAVTAPPAALWLAGLLVAAFLAQSAAPSRLVESLAYAPAPGVFSRPLTLFTAIWLHGGWGHLAMNTAFALAFATPLARFFGPRPRGAAALFLYFVTCGVLGNLGFGLLHAGQPLGLIGASGGVSGLAAGAARIVGGEGRIGGFRSPFVLSMGGAWIVSNLVVALTGSALTSGGAQIAWEAHLVGFASGLLLIRPFAGFAGVSRG